MVEPTHPAGRPSPLNRSGRLERAVMVAAAMLVVGLQVFAIARQSLVGDAPYHLLAGDQALRDGVNTLNFEHPPLFKLLAAWPIPAEDRISPAVEVDQAVTAGGRLFDDPERAERIRLRSRTVFLFAFALPWLGACYLLGRELAGRAAGTLLALGVGLSLNVLPYLCVLQSDTAVSLAFTLTAWTGLRFLRQPSAAWAAGLGAALGLGLAVKFSAVLLLPALAVLAWRAVATQRRLGIAPEARLGNVAPEARLSNVAPEARPRNAAWRVGGYLGLATIIALGVVAGAYAVANRDYDPEAGRIAIRHYCQDGGTLSVDERLHAWQEPLLAVERVSPSLAQWLTGFVGIRAQNSLGVQASYAFGEISRYGRWWYFPVVLLVKTPLVLLAATALAAFAWARRRAAGLPLVEAQGADGARTRLRDAQVLIGGISAIYLATALTSSYNLGMRHLLPIVPFLLLPAILWAAQTRVRRVVVVLVLALEALAVAPVWMSATNTWWLGSLNPTHAALSHSNFEAHQNFISLRHYARKQALKPLYVVHPASTATEVHAYIPEARWVQPGDEIVPGWYAVNGIVEQFLPAIRSAEPGELRNRLAWLRLADSWAPTWDRIRAGVDHGVVAGTFHLYRVTDPAVTDPDVGGPAAGGTRPPAPPD